MNKQFNDFKRFPELTRSLSNYQLVELVYSYMGKSDNSLIFQKHYFPKIKYIFEYVFDNPSRFEEFHRILFEEFQDVLSLNHIAYENKYLIDYIVRNCPKPPHINFFFVALILLSLDNEFIFYKLNYYKNHDDIHEAIDFILTSLRFIPNRSIIINKLLNVISDDMIQYIIYTLIMESYYNVDDLLLSLIQNSKCDHIFNDIIKTNIQHNPIFVKKFIKKILKYNDNIQMDEYVFSNVLFTFNEKFIRNIIDYFKPNKKLLIEALYLCIMMLVDSYKNKEYFAIYGQLNIKYIDMLCEITNIDISDFENEKRSNIEKIYEIFSQGKNGSNIEVSDLKNLTIEYYDYYDSYIEDYEQSDNLIIDI